MSLREYLSKLHALDYKSYFFSEIKYDPSFRFIDGILGRVPSVVAQLDNPQLGECPATANECPHMRSSLAMSRIHLSLHRVELQSHLIECDLKVETVQYALSSHVRR